MDIMEHVKALNERKMGIAHEQRNYIDDAIKAHPTEPFSAEETQVIERMDVDIAAIEKQVNDLVAREERSRDDAALREAHSQVFGEGKLEQDERNEARQLAAWARGSEVRHDDPETPQKNTFALNIRAAQREQQMLRQGASAEEVRALLWDTGSIASGVPTTTARNVYAYMTAGIAALRMPTTKIQSDSGSPIKFPRVNAHGIATQVIAQGTAIGGTDPTFLSMQLDAYKYGQLLQVANETIQDEGFDVVDFVTTNVARSVSEVIDADLIVGTGTGEPLGMMTGAIVGNAGTVATGGTLITPTYENLVDTIYSVNDRYRGSGSAAWLMRDATAGQLRKLRDGAGGTIGQPLWQMSPYQGLNTGQPDLLLGYPVYTDPNVASLASNARIAAFGDWNAYYVRTVGNFTFERSDDFAFNTDLVTFRGKQRIDGDYIDLSAVNLLKQSV